MTPKFEKKEKRVSRELAMPGATPSAECTVFLADIIGSRTITVAKRRETQNQLRKIADKFNEYATRETLAPVEIREGDSIRAVFAAPRVIPLLMWELSALTTEAKLRTGVGFGPLTIVHRFPDDVDGPAYYNAREAQQAARRGSAVFFGFAERDDIALSAIITLLFDRYERLARGQRDAIDAARGARFHSEAADQLGIKRSTMSERLKTAAWDTIERAEEAAATLLATYDRSNAWKRP
jgi:hypothetical protein